MFLPINIKIVREKTKKRGNQKEFFKNSMVIVLESEDQTLKYFKTFFPFSKHKPLTILSFKIDMKLPFK